ncbi:hypothetical protein [Microbacterium terregens]|uniref:Uncharacterized protein n=1 Tax=Microbacterium terregens TaxID=69363 RepID=A0ABV5SWL5_9MICO
MPAPTTELLVHDEEIRANTALLARPSGELLHDTAGATVPTEARA